MSKVKNNNWLYYPFQIKYCYRLPFGILLALMDADLIPVPLLPKAMLPVLIIFLIVIPFAALYLRRNDTHDYPAGSAWYACGLLLGDIIVLLFFPGHFQLTQKLEICVFPFVLIHILYSEYRLAAQQQDTQESP